MNKKKKLLIICCALVLFVILRDFDIIDLNVYSFQMSSMQSSGKTQTNVAPRKGFSYNLVVKYKSETIFKHTHIYDGMHPPIEIEAELQDPLYSGYYALPLFKDFQMTYRCDFSSVKSSQTSTIKGKVAGKITARIHGFCSRAKAKKLALKEAKKQIKSYFQTQLMH